MFAFLLPSGGFGLSQTSAIWGTTVGEMFKVVREAFFWRRKAMTDGLPTTRARVSRFSPGHQGPLGACFATPPAALFPLPFLPLFLPPILLTSIPKPWTRTTGGGPRTCSQCLLRHSHSMAPIPSNSSSAGGSASGLLYSYQTAAVRVGRRGHGRNFAAFRQRADYRAGPQ